MFDWLFGRKQKKVVSPPTPPVQETSPRPATMAENRKRKQEQFQADRDVLNGWRWSCAKQARTCPLCLARDGQLFSVDTPFVECHEGCRCCAIPETKSWEELGFEGIPDTRPKRETGEEWFHRQPESVQRQILGDVAFEDWKGSGYGLRAYIATVGWEPTPAHLEEWADLVKRRAKREAPPKQRKAKSSKTSARAPKA